MKGFAKPCGLPWHLADDVYVPVNSNGEFHWVLAVVALKECFIKLYDSMSSNRSNIKLYSKIQKMATMLPKYLELSGFFKQNERTNWSVLKCYQGKNKSQRSKSDMLLILPNKKAIVCDYHIIFCLATIEIWCYYIFWLMICPADIVDFMLLHTLSFWVMD